MKLAIILLWFITSCFAGELECLSRGIYFEAGNQSYQGKLAVANVIKNRKDKWKLETYCKVVNQETNGRKQFLWIDPKLPIPGTADFKNWQYSRALAAQFIKAPSGFKDNTDGSLYFHSLQVNPNWKKRKTVTIQNHVFYKDD